MKNRSIKIAAALGLTLSMASAAWAGNVAHCEVLIVQVVANDDGTGEAQIATYSPATNFLASLYDEEDGHITTINMQPIQAVLCRRNDIIPSESDYEIMATGIPFILSQDFDSSETDSLTLYWKDDAFEYVYKGDPLPNDGQAILDSRVAEFSTRGLVKKSENAELDAEANIEIKE